MCGIAGYFQPTHFDSAWAQVMASAIAYRGPDDSGVWFDESVGIALAHRRLSIIDLSSAGHQPMVSPCERYVLAFNGEIYNHSALRRELEQLTSHVNWRGQSDTETLLASIRHWGAESALKRAVGMFAIALWDRAKKRLLLARDRMGEKPLYYGWQGEAFLFGSELKAMRIHPSFRSEVNRSVLPLFLRHGYIPGPYSIYRDVFKVPPGSYVVLDAVTGEVQQPIAFWRLQEVVEEGRNSPFVEDDDEAVGELASRLGDAVRHQMLSDVPLGAFLSGGLDSSLLVALMQSESSRPVKTFTIGFEDAAYNEAEYASKVARHLQTDHSELYVTAASAMSVIPEIPRIYDEPFADASQIPTLLVSRLAKRSVKVALSGDGGDELFAGYSRYAVALRWHRGLSRIPFLLRMPIGKLLSSSRPSFNEASSSYSSRWLSKDRIRDLGYQLQLRDMRGVYRRFVSHWWSVEHLVESEREESSFFTSPETWPVGIDFMHWMMYADAMTYLPDGVLTKVDRAAMSVSLESRAPFLDHRVVEFAWRLPLHMKLRDGVSKWLPRRLLRKYLPDELIGRRKMGFGIPIGTWLRGPLREWAGDCLSEACLTSVGYLKPRVVTQIWKEHDAGIRNWEYLLWNVLMFQTWMLQLDNDVHPTVAGASVVC